jgi:dolichol-phosphate mannosyltransferase
MTNRPIDVSVVVPTFREVENLPLLADRVFEATVAANIVAELIVVDDDSRDGTEALCGELARRYDLRLITRKGQRGLASAVIEGFRQARGRLLLCMDADLSHPPEAIPELVRALSDGAEFVIGSRYLDKGGVEEGWGVYRWLNSKIATLLARPLTSISDPLGGYFAVPRDVFFRAAELSPVGYKIALEVLVRSRPQTIAEVPIFFRDRKFGRSKLSLRVQFQYLRHLRRLYLFKYPFLSQLTQFLAVGGLGVIVDVAVYYALQIVLGVGHVTARAISFFVAATHNWFLNRRYTFVYGREGAAVGQWASYLLVVLVGFVVNVGTYVVLTTHTQTFARSPLLALLTGIALGTASNFLAARWFVFRGRTAARPT